MGGTGLGGMGSTHTAGSTGYGLHGSDTANTRDPRADPGTHGTTGLGTGSTGCGPHDSRVVNELDPRIGSDRGSRAGLGSTTHGPTEQATGVSTGTHGTRPGGAGPHQAPILNKTDPRVDSDRDYRASHAAAPPGGPAPNTAGPHKSDLMNKLDPRVDSNLDGSRTVGGDKTYSAGTTGGAR